MRIVDGFKLRDIMGQKAVIGEGIAQVDFNKMIVLNASAAYLWQSVEGIEFDIAMLQNLLVEKYGIDRACAERDAAAIAGQWISTGLVTR